MQAKLSPSSMIVSLEQVASARTEQECAQALVAAASLIQQSILAEQDPASFHEAMNTVPDRLAVQLGAVVDRSVNFHLLEDGGTLGLWLLPVVVSTAKKLPSVLPLETKTLHALKMSGALLSQLSLTAAQTGGDRTGWTYVLPALYSDAQIRNADVGALIRLPHEARQVVRGTLDAISFDTGKDCGEEGDGASLYFLPFVAFAPDGHAPMMPAASSKTVSRMSQWAAVSLTHALGPDFETYVASQPQPYTLALRVGARLRMDVHLRELMARVTADSGVEANGLAALVAPYATRQMDGSLLVGVSLVARMTRNVVATLALPVESDDGQEEVALITHILRDMGMACIQQHASPIDTISCQHCGGLQFALPSPDVAFNGLMTPETNHVH